MRVWRVWKDVEDVLTSPVAPELLSITAIPMAKITGLKTPMFVWLTPELAKRHCDFMTQSVWECETTHVWSTPLEIHPLGIGGLSLADVEAWWQGESDETIATIPTEEGVGTVMDLQLVREWVVG